MYIPKLLQAHIDREWEIHITMYTGMYLCIHGHEHFTDCAQNKLVYRRYTLQTHVTLMHSHTHTNTHTHTHTHTHKIHTHACMHTHTHTQTLVTHCSCEGATRLPLWQMCEYSSSTSTRYINVKYFLDWCCVCRQEDQQPCWWISQPMRRLCMLTFLMVRLLFDWLRVQVFSTCGHSQFVHMQSLELLAETRILAGMKIENHGKIYFPLE